MITSSISPRLEPAVGILSSSSTLAYNKPREFSGLANKPQQIRFTQSLHSHSTDATTATGRRVLLQKSAVSVAASVAFLLCSGPAKAGFLSGFSGIESVPGPQLPSFEFLNRWNEENQKKYAEADARFRDSPVLKELLERSKRNKEKNRQEVADKYCIRGAEWGVGDCSTEGMSPEERESFISMLKQKAGVKD